MSDASTLVSVAVVAGFVTAVCTVVAVRRLLLRETRRQSDLITRQSDLTTRLVALLNDVNAAMTRVADASTQALSARHRPWLSVATSGPVTRGDFLQWDFLVENKGTVPGVIEGYTIDVREDQRIVFMDGGVLVHAVWPGAEATPLPGMKVALEEKGALMLRAEVIVRYADRKLKYWTRTKWEATIDAHGVQWRCRDIGWEGDVH